MGGKASTPTQTPSSDSCKDPATEAELRLVLVGRTGAGKSETGNHILLKSKKVDNPFKVALCASSVTQICDYSTNEVFDQKLVVVDTPGLFDTKHTNKETLKKITKFMLFLQPGPHAIIFVLQVGRITKEMKETMALLLKLFQEGVYRHMLILFTRKDELVHQGITLEEYIEEVPDDIKEVISKCQNRCIAFDNRANDDENEKQVKELLDMVNAIMKLNGGKCYVSDLQKHLSDLFAKEELAHPDTFRKKVQNEETSLFWQAVVVVAKTFGFNLK